VWYLSEVVFLNKTGRSNEPIAGIYRLLCVLYNANVKFLEEDLLDWLNVTYPRPTPSQHEVMRKLIAPIDLPLFGEGNATHAVGRGVIPVWAVCLVDRFFLVKTGTRSYHHHCSGPIIGLTS
jgi:hypothetical protein